jgi:hypothetical protein
MPLPLVAAGVGAAIGGIQALVGAGQAKRANRDLKRLFSQRQAYQTPEQIFEILNMQQFNAQQGFSDETQSFLTGQAGAGLSAGLGTASRLGADPNQLGGIIDNYYQDIFKIGAESDLVKMKKFDSLTSALNLVAENKTAEWQSQENLIKDQMAAAAQRLGAGQQNIQSGLNAGLSSISALAGMNLFKTKTPNTPELLASNIPATVPAGRTPDLSIGNQRGNFRI